MSESILESVISGSYRDEVELTSPLGAYKRPAPRIKCADGASLSVQASRRCYCEPRNNWGPYVTVEVGYPSVDPPESWRDYIDGYWETADRTRAVYGYVPIGMVREFVRLHGGES